MRKDHKFVIDSYLETKSLRKTANLSGFSKSGVEHILKLYNIKRFKNFRNGTENSSYKALLRLPEDHPRRLVRDPKFMLNLYVEKKLSLPKISKLLNISTSTVLIGLKQCGIKRRTKSDSLRGIPKPSLQGSKNYRWKGGLSGWRKLARGRLNEHFVRPCMERDSFTCQWCSSKKNICVHHHKRTFMEIVNIVKNKISAIDLENFVNEIVREHSLEDGITLCKICHDKFHNS